MKMKNSYNPELLKKQAGDIPEDTCKLLDDIKLACNSFFLSDYYDGKKALEKIRADNIQLRNLGRFWYVKYVEYYVEKEKL